MRLLLFLLLVGCGPGAEGLRLTPPGDGPHVVIDWDAEPFPEIPLPNDLATRPDPDSPTGLRLNLSELAATHSEREARRNLNELSGFGIQMPITVRFDQPLDLDRIAALHGWDSAPEDGAILLIDVGRASPDFGTFVDLDLGSGRFPQDVTKPDRYFPQDPHPDPSLLFEGTDEDLNANGILDPGEDTDGDGVLDQPNVYPLGGDPRGDLLTWYERQTDTLIARPVLPLREKNTYAVVLTNRLVNEAREPVVSPWEWVHHTRQTEALEPIVPALATAGLSISDVAFAWSFTTGDITGEMVDLRRGLHGEGPWASLATDFPALVDQADVMHNRDGIENPYRLPTDVIIGLFLQLATLPAAARDMLAEGYAHSDVLVGSSFISPDLLVDRDGDGDDSDEICELDRAAGTLVAGERRISQTCFIPKSDGEFQPPYDVALWGHGYGSNRFDLILMAWELNRVGRALCAFDWPSHGMALSPSDAAQYLPLLEGGGLLPAVEHLLKGRARDLNNDGVADSGADFLVGDPFKTRDHVRQVVLDIVQWTRAMRACGTGTMDVDVDFDGQNEASCDFDGDGVADFGGPDALISYAGGSMGGITAAVLAPIEPELEAVVAHAAGGGLADLAARTDFAGVPEAVMGPLLTPLLLATPDGEGLVLSQFVTTADSGDTVPFARLDSIPEGGSIEVENLDNGEVRSGPLLPGGFGRVPFPADAVTAAEKRTFAAIPETGPAEGYQYDVEDTTRLGDRLRVTVYNAAGVAIDPITSFGLEATHLGVTYRPGQPLIALGEGSGRMRGSPEFRRLAGLAGMAMEGADPNSYARAILKEPYEELGGRPARFLLNPTIGDEVVMISAGIALARSIGLVDWRETDPRYGMSVDQWLVEREVVHGLEEFGPYTNDEGAPILFDPDDLDDGTDDFNAPSDAPLRATIDHGDGVVALRLPYIQPTGSHAIVPPDPELAFDINVFTLNQMGHFLAVDGAEVLDDHCLERDDCDWVRALPE